MRRGESHLFGQCLPERCGEGRRTPDGENLPYFTFSQPPGPPGEVTGACKGTERVRDSRDGR